MSNALRPKNFGGDHGRFRAAGGRTRRRRRKALGPALLRAGAAHRRLRAELPRPHHLQRPDRADQKGVRARDTTMGLLAGFGFVLFYSLLGIPIARVADRLNRRNIVAIAFAFWSAMTFLCGMASSVATLALGADRRRHRRIRRHARLAIDGRRSLQQERAPARARHLRHRHLSRRIPRLFHRRLCQPALRLAHGVLHRGPARHRARRRACG